MVWRSNTNRKGIRRGVQRGIIALRVPTNIGSLEVSPSNETSTAERWVESLAVSLYCTVVNASIALNLVPFIKTTKEGYVVKPKKQLREYSAYRVITGLVMVYRVVTALKVCTEEDFNTATLLALIGGLVYCNCWAISFYNPTETACLLNNFNRILSYLEAQAGREFRIYSELRLSLKVIASISCIIPCTICMSIANGMLFGGLPTSFIRLADVFIDIRTEDRIWWQLLLLPLEIIPAVSLLLPASIVCIFAFTTAHLSRLFGEEIRSVNVVNLVTRKKVEQMCICWEVCDKISRPWMIVHVFSIIVSISCAAATHFNVAIKYTNLPLLVHAAQTLLGPVFIILLCLGLYDALVACQISGRVISDQLTDFTSTGLRYLTIKSRRELLKKVKAMRPIAIPIGSFTDVSFSSMVAILEEIMNGVLVLLTL